MELDSDINSSTDKHRLVSNVEFRSDKGKNNIDRVRNKEHEESEHEEGDDRRGTAENLGLIDLVGCGACRLCSHLPSGKVFPLTKGRRRRSS